jgi:choline dehydrogenase-like flavoprotein
MATKLKEVDVVTIGVGWTGSILARELTKAGLTVVGLERGSNQSPAQDFTIPSIRDEFKYRLRTELMQDTAMETLTLRHAPGETALPWRRWGAFSPGDGVGGAGVSSSPISTASRNCAAPPARPAISTARRSMAATSSRARGRRNIRTSRW